MNKIVYSLSLIMVVLIVAGCTQLACDVGCTQDSDCVSITEITGCYYSCTLLDEKECASAPRCALANKGDVGATCVIGQPCVEPKEIECVNGECIGKW